MTLRRRLALWYGGVIAVVLAVALTLAYLLHAEAHDSDVDSALGDMANKAQEQIDGELHSGIPIDAVDLSDLSRAIDEPHAAWFVINGKVVATAGEIDLLSFKYAAVTDMLDGWHTSYTTEGRVRTYVVPIGIGHIVTAADLSVIDRANADLRMTYFILLLLGVGLGMATASTIAGSALRPVAAVTETAQEIATSRDFSRRVHVRGDPNDELVVLAKTFDDMLTSLDDAYRQQQRFLGDVSHELRTPLTTIRGNAELLSTSTMSSEQQHESLLRIARESGRLSRLVDELLMLARAEAAEAFAPRAVHLDEIVMETFDELRPIAGGRLRVRWIESAVVDGERDRLKQLVLALVDNALRYTPEPGGVDISLSDDGHDSVLRIEDEGIGIDDADLPKVFDRFYRSTAARRVNSSGSGLGLAIVRWIVERHHGSVRIERRGTRGTVVTVRIPLAAKPAQAAEPKPAAARAAPA